MRIVGGTLRSRALKAPRGDSTRPTTDRVREALFSILASRTSMQDARVLDLYAGTGALAFEALSRGASEAWLVEKQRDALLTIRDNASTLGVTGQVHVIAKTVERARFDLTGLFDVVFIDPPYAQADSTIEMLSSWLADKVSGLVIFEHASGHTLGSIANLTLDDTRVYGDTALSFFTRTASHRVEPLASAGHGNDPAS